MIVQFIKKNLLALIIPLFFLLVIFHKTFINGLLPIPTDILYGAYYPWLDNSFGYSVHIPVKNPLPSDVVSIIYPWRFLGMSILKSGHLPLWDPTILLGIPLLANFQSALLNPTNILFFVFSNEVAWAIQTIIQPLLIFLAMYMYLRKINISLFSSIIGGLLFAFCGYVMVWLEYNTIGFTLIFTPLIFWVVQKILEKPSLRQSLLLGIFICLQIFSGYPLIAIYTLGAGLVYFFYFYFLSYRQMFIQKLATLLFGIISGICFSAVLLIPGVEVSSQSIYKLDNSALAGNIKYLSLKSMITYLVPDFYGNPATANFWGDGSYDNTAFFIPSVGVMLFLLSIFTGLAFKKINFIYLLLISLTLLYATQNGFSNILGNFDFFGLNSSVNARALFIISFSSAALAAKMLDELKLKTYTTFSKIVPLVIYIGIALGLIITYIKVNDLKLLSEHLLSITPNDPQAFKDYINQINYDANYLAGNLKVALRNMAIPIAITLVGTILLFIKNSKIVFITFVFLILVSSKISFDKYSSFTNTGYFYKSNLALESLQKSTGDHRFIHEKAELLPGNTWTPYLLKSPAGQNNLASLKTARYLSLVNQNTLNDGLLTRFIEIGNLKSPLINTLDVETVALLNRKVIESIPDKSGRPFPWYTSANLKEVSNNETVRVYQNQDNLGPAWFSSHAECIPSLTDTVELLVRSNYHPKETIIVDCNSGGLDDRNIGQVSLLKTSPNYHEYKVNTPDDNYLTISQSIYPGWKVYVDQQKSQIKPVNIALTGVFIPKGEHTVKLVYSPDSFKWGLVITGLTILSWIIIFNFYCRPLSKNPNSLSPKVGGARLFAPPLIRSAFGLALCIFCKDKMRAIFFIVPLCGTGTQKPMREN